MGYLDHVEKKVFPGGYFFASVASAVSSRPGPVRARVADEQKQWTNHILETVKQAKHSGQLSADTDPGRLTLELSTMLTGADLANPLREDPNILEGVRDATRSRVGL